MAKQADIHEFYEESDENVENEPVGRATEINKSRPTGRFCLWMASRAVTAELAFEQVL